MCAHVVALQAYAYICTHMHTFDGKSTPDFFVAGGEARGFFHAMGPHPRGTLERASTDADRKK
jgi:hypothetical protein